MKPLTKEDIMNRVKPRSWDGSTPKIVTVNKVLEAKEWLKEQLEDQLNKCCQDCEGYTSFGNDISKINKLIDEAFNIGDKE